MKKRFCFDLQRILGINVSLDGFIREITELDLRHIAENVLLSARIGHRHARAHIVDVVSKPELFSLKIQKYTNHLRHLRSFVQNVHL